MVLEINFNKDVNKNYVTPFPQGVQFLSLQDNKINNLSSRADELTNPNGYDRSNTFDTQSCLQKTSNFSMNADQSLIEGFDNFPRCEEKKNWMKTNWNKPWGNQLYIEHGGDGSEKSIDCFLGNVDNWCPPTLDNCPNTMLPLAPENYSGCVDDSIETKYSTSGQNIKYNCMNSNGTSVPMYKKATCDSYNGNLSNVNDSGYGECLNKDGTSISWQNRILCSDKSKVNDNVINNQYKTLLNNSGSSLDSDSSNSGPYNTIVDFHDRNHIGTPMQDAWSQGLEGFTNEKQSTFSGYRNPDNPIYQKNLQDKNFSLEKQEKLFSQANKYNTELNNLYNKANMFSETNLSNNPYKGRNVSLSSGAKGYVTERNVFKWYPNSDVVNNTQGKNGCGTGMDYTDLGVDGSFKNFGSIIQSSPSLLVGTPMKSGQACGNAGSNVQITQSVDPSLINDKYLGCYKRNGNFEEQFDLGQNTTKQACKTRAIDLGKSSFALTDKKGDSGTCWVSGTDYNTKNPDGTIDKLAEKIGSTNMFNGVVNSSEQIGGGLLKDGTLAIGLVPGGAPSAGEVFGLSKDNNVMGHYLINKSPAIANCNKYIGGSVNMPENLESSLTWNNNDCKEMISVRVNR